MAKRNSNCRWISRVQRGRNSRSHGQSSRKAISVCGFMRRWNEVFWQVTRTSSSSVVIPRRFQLNTFVSCLSTRLTWPLAQHSTAGIMGLLVVGSGQLCLMAFAGPPVTHCKIPSRLCSVVACLTLSVENGSTLIGRKTSCVDSLPSSLDNDRGASTPPGNCRVILGLLLGSAQVMAVAVLLS